MLEAAQLANWGQAFAYLERLGRDRKAAGRPLIPAFDEVQYLAAADASLVSRLQDFLETVKHDDLPLFVILAGSSISFFEGQIAANAALRREPVTEGRWCPGEPRRGGCRPGRAP